MKSRRNAKEEGKIKKKQKDLWNENQKNEKGARRNIMTSLADANKYQLTHLVARCESRRNGKVHHKEYRKNFPTNEQGQQARSAKDEPI